MSHGDVALEEADLRQVDQRVLAGSGPIGLDVCGAVGLVHVGDRSGGIRMPLGLQQQLVAGRAKAQHGDVVRDQRIRIGIQPQHPAHAG
jgi:hypothetical protein